MIGQCKEIIDREELSDYDVEDIEVYLSESGQDRKWSIVLGDYWIDMIIPREHKYISLHCKNKYVEPLEIAEAIRLPLRRNLQRYINARRTESNE